ncbi:hypothetical protein HMPREF6485_2127 [Segatella buccae ATCC 33574]|uniref:Uncharacterized protein n=1 Tax=Segatella buccae ATCC 33574 TaxID=873513 RepID=E6K941_9BACT|nr:hypothetical protein HMPREF6485_2127 [Segatella buccae ATCC 33574]
MTNSQRCGCKNNHYLRNTQSSFIGILSQDAKSFFILSFSCHLLVESMKQ